MARRKSFRTDAVRGQVAASSGPFYHPSDGGLASLRGHYLNQFTAEAVSL